MTAGIRSHFVYEVSRSGKCWWYKLKPSADFDRNRLCSDAKKLLDHVEKGVSLQQNGVEAIAGIPELIAYLRDSLQRCYEQRELRPLSFSFRDEVFIWQKTEENLYHTVVNIRSELTDDAYEGIYVLFASLYLYFSEVLESSSLIRVYSAWQRYNLIKRIYEREVKGQHSADQDELARRNELIKQDILDHEFASAYRSLANILLDEANSYACRVLWRGGRYWWKKRRSKKAKVPIYPLSRIRYWLDLHRKGISDPQIRQRLRLSMPLEPLRGEVFDSGTKKTPEPPLPAPVCFENNLQISWPFGVRLHCRFEKKTGQAAIRRMISDELLPRYDVRSATLMAYLVSRLGRAGKVGRLVSMVIRCLLLPPAMVLAFGLILVLVFLVGLGFDLTTSWFSLPRIIALSVGIPVTSLVCALIGVGTQNGSALLLPRITGGIVIGYFPLLIASEPWYLALYTSQHHSVWFGEWLIILLIAGGYLYREAYPFVLQGAQAFWRSFKVLVWATVQAVLIGFLLILFSAPVYRQVKYDPDRISSQASTKAWVKPSQPCLETPTQAGEKPVAAGLDYCVEVPWVQAKFPVSALLTFAPISLLLGIILQILWEEKSVTASVWPSESR
jgi:hypothetical protein